MRARWHVARELRDDVWSEPDLRNGRIVPLAIGVCLNGKGEATTQTFMATRSWVDDTHPGLLRARLWLRLPCHMDDRSTYE
jgi:hypothetical protein